MVLTLIYLAIVANEAFCINCETNIDECQSSPCLNGGNCTDLDNAYKCKCTIGFYGEQCKERRIVCSPGACLNGGSCIEDKDSYTCECVVGFSGRYCEANIDDCVRVNCLNGGTCQDQVNNFKCMCKEGYSGRFCNDSSAADEQKRKRLMMSVIPSGVVLLFVLLAFAATASRLRRLHKAQDQMSKATERELRSIQKKQKHMMSVKRDNPDGNTAGMQNGAIPLTVASKKAPRKNTLSIDEVLLDQQANVPRPSALRSFHYSNTPQIVETFENSTLQKQVPDRDTLRKPGIKEKKNPSCCERRNSLPIIVDEATFRREPRYVSTNIVEAGVAAQERNSTRMPHLVQGQPSLGGPSLPSGRDQGTFNLPAGRNGVSSQLQVQPAVSFRPQVPANVQPNMLTHAPPYQTPQQNRMFSWLRGPRRENETFLAGGVNHNSKMVCEKTFDISRAQRLILQPGRQNLANNQVAPVANRLQREIPLMPEQRLSNIHPRYES